MGGLVGGVVEIVGGSAFRLRWMQSNEETITVMITIYVNEVVTITVMITIYVNEVVTIMVMMVIIYVNEEATYDLPIKRMISWTMQRIRERKREWYPDGGAHTPQDFLLGVRAKELAPVEWKRD